MSDKEDHELQMRIPAYPDATLSGADQGALCKSMITTSLDIADGDLPTAAHVLMCAALNLMTHGENGLQPVACAQAAGSLSHAIIQGREQDAQEIGTPGKLH